MRTVRIDNDHVAEYDSVSKGVFAYRVRHRLTHRLVLEQHATAERGQSAAKCVLDHAQRSLDRCCAERLANSIAFADGKPVAGAPAVADLPPTVAADVQAGVLDIPVSAVVNMIQSTYRTVRPIEGESRDSYCSRQMHATLDVGHRILIGATDAVIMGVARGKVVLTGSLRTGILATWTVV